MEIGNIPVSVVIAQVCGRKGCAFRSLNLCAILRMQSNFLKWTKYSHAGFVM